MHQTAGKRCLSFARGGKVTTRFIRIEESVVYIILKEVAEMEVLFLLVIIFVIWLTNHLVFKYAGKNKKRRILSGLAVMLLAPVIYYLTFGSIAPFDLGGFGTAIVSLLYGIFFFLNGLVLIAIGILTKDADQSPHREKF